MTRTARRALLPALAGLAGVLLVLLVALTAFGADPSSLPAEVLAGGDPRSEGAGPGLVGNPLFILLGVVGLGLATVSVTAVVARLVRRS